LNEPLLLHEETLKCPVCGNETYQVQLYLYEIPAEGKILIMVGECSSCGYRHRDVFPAEYKSPVRIELKVETEEDLETLVFRSSSADVELPELGVEVMAGALYQGVITTVRGLLETFLTELGSNCGQKCDEIKEAMEGKKKFTLIIKDPSGLSYVLNRKAAVTPL